MPSAPEQLAALFEQGGWNSIQAAVRSGRTESLHLDFKRKSDPKVPELGKDDRKNLAEALSGFANAEGGIIVWGVRTHSRDGYDQAVDIAPIQDIRGFLAHLAELTPEMVSPAVNGLRHFGIEDPLSPNTGVVITVIPESDRTPHMARGPNQQKYFRRTGSSFRPLEHYEVADLFGRRAHPVLSASTPWKARFFRSGSDGAIVEIKINFIIQNLGRGLTRYPCLTIGQPTGWQVTHWPGKEGGPDLKRLVPAPTGWWLRLAAGADTVVYPGDEIDFASLSFEVSNRRTIFPDMHIPYRVIAAEAEGYESDVILTGDEIKEATSQALSDKGVH